MDIISLSNGKIKVKKSYLDKHFLSVMPENIFWMDEDVNGYVTISKSSLDKMISDKNQRDQKEKALYRCAELNNKGMALEKTGDIEGAIRVYEENIAGDKPYPAYHSFNRLMILYRKQKNYKDEMRVIEKAIKTFPDFVKYRDRLEKTKVLLSKL